MGAAKTRVAQPGSCRVDERASPGQAALNAGIRLGPACAHQARGGMRSSHGPRSCVARQPEATAEAALRCSSAKHDACQPHKLLILGGGGWEQRVSEVLDAEDLLARRAGLAIFCAAAPRRSDDRYSLALAERD